MNKQNLFKSELDNGLVILHDYIPDTYTLAIRVCIKFGSRYEPESKKGIAHFLEHMSFKGTNKRTAKQIVDEIDFVGGDINAFTSKETTNYTLNILNSHAELGFDILSDMITDSVFEKGEVEKERKVILQEIAEDIDDPDEFLTDSFIEKCYKNQSMGHNILGTKETVNGIQQQDLFDFVRNYYVPNNMVIAVAGNIENSKLLELINKYFGKLQRKEVDKFVASKFMPGTLNLERELEQSHYTIAIESLPFTEDSIYHVSIFSTILGGGMSSRLFQEIRENLALAYSVGSSTNSFSDTGIFYINASTSHDKIYELNKAIAKILKESKEIENYEFEKAKNQIIASLKMSNDSIYSRCGFLLGQYNRKGKIVFLEDIINIIKKISIADIQNLYDKIVLNKEVAIGILGDKFDMNKIYDEFKL